MQDARIVPLHPLPWESKSDTTRPIELLAGYGDEQIVCIVNNSFLQDGQEYEAFRIAGKMPTCRNQIIIGDKHNVDFSLSMRSNLFATLRSSTILELRTLMADAMCINQSAPMSAVKFCSFVKYTKGRKTPGSGFGPSDENTWKAFSFIRKLVPAKNSQAANKDIRFYYEMCPQEQTDYGLPYILDPLFMVFSALLGPEWFTRV